MCRGGRFTWQTPCSPFCVSVCVRGGGAGGCRRVQEFRCGPLHAADEDGVRASAAGVCVCVCVCVCAADPWRWGAGDNDGGGLLSQREEVRGVGGTGGGFVHRARPPGRGVCGGEAAAPVHPPGPPLPRQSPADAPSLRYRPREMDWP